MRKISRSACCNRSRSVSVFDMIRSIALVAILFAAGTAVAQQRAQPASPAPEEIGRFGDWVAYTAQENGQKVCYAGVKAKSSAPNLSGRGEVILYVTHRPGSRDQIMLLSGYNYPSGAEVTVSVDGSGGQTFYTSGRAAFARDGRPLVASFRRGNDAAAKGPAPRGSGQVTDNFSLRGFTAAYEAIGKACPAR